MKRKYSAKHLIFTLLLLIAAGFVCAEAYTQRVKLISYRNRLVSESGVVSNYTSSVDEQQAYLDTLNADEADALDEETSQINAQADEYTAGTEEAEAKTQEINGEIEQKQIELEEVKGDEEYHDTVTAAYEKGYNRVLGYIADSEEKYGKLEEETDADGEDGDGSGSLAGDEETADSDGDNE